MILGYALVQTVLRVRVSPYVNAFGMESKAKALRNSDAAP